MTSSVKRVVKGIHRERVQIFIPLLHTIYKVKKLIAFWKILWPYQMVMEFMKHPVRSTM